MQIALLVLNGRNVFSKSYLDLLKAPPEFVRTLSENPQDQWCNNKARNHKKDINPKVAERKVALIRMKQNNC